MVIGGRWGQWRQIATLSRQRLTKTRHGLEVSTNLHRTAINAHFKPNVIVLYDKLNVIARVVLQRSHLFISRVNERVAVELEYLIAFIFFSFNRNFKKILVFLCQSFYVHYNHIYPGYDKVFLDISLQNSILRLLYKLCDEWW